jgi:hypothetical protein
VKLNITEKLRVLCSCCGNKVETMWSFQQDLVVGHFTDGHQIQGQQDFSFSQHRHGEFCLGGYSSAELHPKFDIDKGET